MKWRKGGGGGWREVKLTPFHKKIILEKPNHIRVKSGNANIFLDIQKFRKKVRHITKYIDD